MFNVPSDTAEEIIDRRSARTSAAIAVKGSDEPTSNPPLDHSVVQDDRIRVSRQHDAPLLDERQRVNIRIEHVEILSGSPAMPIAVEGWMNLIDHGMMQDDTCLLAWNNKALLAYSENDTLLGVLVYTDIEWRQMYGVVLGYVRLAYRKHGVYRKLWKALVKEAQKEGRLKIEGATSVDNHTMQEVMRKLGRQATRIEYQYDVPNKETGTTS